MPVVVNLKTGHRVTVSDENGFEVSCTCRRGTSCEHIVRVVCQDAAALEHPSQVHLLYEAREILQRNGVERIPWLEKCRDDAKRDPGRAHEIPALDAAIAQELNRIPPDDPNQAARDAVRRLTRDD